MNMNSDTTHIHLAQHKTRTNPLYPFSLPLAPRHLPTGFSSWLANDQAGPSRPQMLNHLCSRSTLLPKPRPYMCTVQPTPVKRPTPRARLTANTCPLARSLTQKCTMTNSRSLRDAKCTSRRCSSVRFIYRPARSDEAVTYPTLQKQQRPSAAPG